MSNATILPVFASEQLITDSEYGFESTPILLGWSVRTGEPNGGRTYTLLDTDGFQVAEVNRMRKIGGALLTALLSGAEKVSPTPEFTALYSDAKAKLEAGQRVTVDEDGDADGDDADYDYPGHDGESI